ncbi:MAG: ribosome small subunit-dependent GTPase A, partial [Spirochaetaceae bacterium]|nr:ribosome small subunit-dependent GTPase A [Spirochaetaceae bacterium]
MDGVVLSGSNNVFLVLCADGSRRSCGLKGKRLKGSGAYNALAAGDNVEVIPDPSDPAKGQIGSLLPRRNVFGRFNEKGRARQAIAANVDQVVCVSSPAYPPFRPRFVDRVAVLAEAAGVPLLIALNKADLGIPEDTLRRLGDYEALGYSVLIVSAETGRGIEELNAAIAGKTSVFTGQSGVGKSTLLNLLSPGLLLRTGEVSEKYARGKHTTTMAEL